MDADQPLQVETKTPEELVEETIFPELAAKSENEPMPTLASDYLPLKDFYGIDSLDQQTQEKLQSVWEHFSKDAKTPGTVLKKIRIEQMNLTKPNIGDTSLNQMYNYVRILRDLESAKEMKEAYRDSPS